MRYLLIPALSLLLLANSSFATPPNKKPPEVIKYTLELVFDKEHQKIKAIFHNKSAIDFRIRRDFSPFSILFGGINLSLFTESKNLTPLQIDYMTGEDTTQILIPANKYHEEYIYISEFPKKYCDTLATNSILVFWSYFFSNENYILEPTEGALRINRSNVECNN